MGVAQEATYDYVIVGGGTAGLTLVARLSEDPGTSVAVIEAGYYYQIKNPLVSSIPVCGVSFTGSSPKDTNPGVDWSFVTAPQMGADNRELHYARGKCLGGSSGRNLMMYQRPDEGSLQQWADMVGDQSYNFKNMLPYFQKSCKFTPPDPKLASDANIKYLPDAFAPSGGPLHVSYPNNGRPFSTYLGSAFNEIGIPDAEDFNSGKLVGSQFITVTIDPTTATRSSSQTAFLDTCQARPNVKVFRETFARRIVFDKDKRATGVDVDSRLFVRARKEVILSAGAFQSPELLMISGIGPAATLSGLGIPVVADRPGVGQNMTDHVMFGPSYRVRIETIPTLLSDPDKLVPALNDYFRNAQGPFTNQACDFVTWEKVPRGLISKDANDVVSKLPVSWPDVEYYAVDAYFGHSSSPLFRAAADGYPTDKYDYASIIISPAAPRSRGSVTIKSAEVADLPIIDPNWLTDPIDAEVAIAGYKRAREVFASDTIRAILADPVEYFPGPTVQTDEELLELIRKSVTTAFHASTTCRMGRRHRVSSSQCPVIGVGRPQATSFCICRDDYGRGST
ncbi:choline dehydrogenase [Xylariaceae sp. FL0662B]|nr:choline dehydrogenase [Xylariaceae sp. FL0662B]